MRLLGVVSSCACLLASVHLLLSRNVAVERLVGPGMPYATLQAAYTAAQPGDTITIHAGQYAGWVRFRKANLTIRSYPGEAVTIQYPATAPVGDNNLWVFSPGVTFRGLEIVGGGVYALKFDTGATDCIVEDCIIRDSGNDNIKLVLHADRVTIRRCEITNTPGVPKGSNAQAIDDVTAYNLTVQDCYIHDIHDCQIVIKGGAGNCVVERCLLINGVIGIDVGQSSGDFFDTSLDPLKYDNVDCIVRDNLILNMQDAGIGCYGALRPKLLNNTLMNCASVAQGALFFTTNEVNLNGKIVYQPCVDATVMNNVVGLAGGSSRFNVYVMPIAYGGSWNVRNERYFKPGGTARFVDASGKIGPLFSGNLAQWQAHLAAMGAVNADRLSSEGDPGLTADWNIAPGSPLIGAGCAGPQQGLDYNGSTRTTTNDIGGTGWNLPGPKKSYPPQITPASTGTIQ